MTLSYIYTTDTSFSTPIGRHTLLLRCLPQLLPCQEVLSEEFSISQCFGMRESSDSLGNRTITGSTAERHAELCYKSSGMVRLSTYCIPDANPHGMYTMPSALTMPSHDIMELMPVLSSSFLANCLSIMHSVHSCLTYSPGTTIMNTTAAEALRSQRGVCQDYAHIMLSLCRKAGYAARYVCGLMMGEGATHAWVEVHDGMCWYAFDPTNDTAIANGYIKLAHGRDALDCPVIRGVYTGVTKETTNINVIVNEI